MDEKMKKEAEELSESVAKNCEYCKRIHNVNSNVAVMMDRIDANLTLYNAYCPICGLVGPQAETLGDAKMGWAIVNGALYSLLKIPTALEASKALAPPLSSESRLPHEFFFNQKDIDPDETLN